MRGSFVRLGDCDTHMGNDGDHWRGVTGRNGLPDLSLSGVSLLNFSASHGLSIMNTILFEHKDAHKCIWYKSTLGLRSMINLFIESSDLRQHFLDTWVKRGPELSTDHHLVSWVRWWGKPLDRPGKPRCIVRVNWEGLENVPVQQAFNSHLWQTFSGILVEVIQSFYC